VCPGSLDPTGSGFSSASAVESSSPAEVLASSRRISFSAFSLQTENSEKMNEESQLVRLDSKEDGTEEGGSRERTTHSRSRVTLSLLASNHVFLVLRSSTVLGTSAEEIGGGMERARMAERTERGRLSFASTIFSLSGGGAVTLDPNAAGAGVDFLDPPDLFFFPPPPK